MKLHVHSIGVVAGSCVLASAVAQAQVTKVVAEPEVTILNVPVNIKVTGGRARCSELVINFNDGNPAQHYSSEQLSYSGGQLSFEVSKSWPDDDANTFPNVKVVKVQGIGCGGEAATTIQVMEELTIAPRPKIESYLGFAKPGGVALVLGHAFGSAQGKAQARLRTWNGGKKIIELGIVENSDTGAPEWQPTGIGVEWPSDLAGFPDQDASIWVTRPDGKSSGEYTVPFKPTLELKMLPQSDVEVVSCSADANYNGCNDSGGKGDVCVADSAPFLTASDSSISGRHYNCWGVVGDDAGVDTYQITLANGWALEELTFEKFVDTGEGWIKSPAGFSAGKTEWKAKIEWSVTPSDDLRYEGLVFIRGPKGVPHQ